jgi:hypothetical protein
VPLAGGESAGRRMVFVGDCPPRRPGLWRPAFVGVRAAVRRRKATGDVG